MAPRREPGHQGHATPPDDPDKPSTVFSVTSLDLPMVYFEQEHTFGGAKEHATAIDANYTFKTYLATYSADFSQTYTAYVEADWGWNLHLTYNAGSPPGHHWQNNGSSVPMTVIYQGHGETPDVSSAVTWTNGKINTPYQQQNDNNYS